jgi:dimethylpropiothetin dethiomethylase
MGQMETRLNDVPDWKYVFQEIDQVYHLGSAGGSTIIRSHQRRVRETISKIVKSNPYYTPRQPENKPVSAHWGRALDLADSGPLANLSRVLYRVESQLTWEYGYQKVPRELAKRYVYCEMMGPQGPIQAEGLILGLVLFAPGTTYPQHRHDEIEESYISLAGAWSENDSAVYAPGSLILNRSAQHHRITVGNRDPCLLAYAWIGPPERLSTPDFRFSKLPRRQI